MDLFGPFLITGRAITTSLSLRAGDQLSVLTSGLLTALLPGAAVPDTVTADGIALTAAPAGSPVPGLGLLSLVARVGNQPLQLGSGLMALPSLQQGVPVGGPLSLDVNAPPLTDFQGGDGWSVYLVRAAAGEQMPLLRDWTFFQDLTSVSTPVRGGIAAAVIGTTLHVFWIEQAAVNGLLNYVTIDPTGAISPTTTIDTEVVLDSQISAVVHRGTVNVFYCVTRRPPPLQGGLLGVLRRGVLNPAGVFDLMDIDGGGSGAQGAISGLVGLFNTAVASGNDLHVIYWAGRDRNQPGDPGDGFGAVIDDLRHARVSITGPEVIGAPFIWLADTIDGAGGGAGRVAGETGRSVCATLDVAAQVHVFYALRAIAGRTSGNDLRHAEYDWIAGNAQAWRFETLDGAGRTLANAGGQMRGNVGMGTGCVLHNGELHVFYNDLASGNLRWGVKAQGAAWNFQTIDGLSSALGGPRRYGPTPDMIRVGHKAAVSLGDQISVFYDDQDANVLRHAYKRPGLPWMMEVVDGDIPFGGRFRSAVGTSAAVVRGGALNLIYFDAGRQRLRHAVLGP